MFMAMHAATHACCDTFFWSTCHNEVKYWEQHVELLQQLSDLHHVTQPTGPRRIAEMSKTHATGCALMKGEQDPAFKADDQYPAWLWELVQPEFSPKELVARYEGQGLSVPQVGGKQFPLLVGMRGGKHATLSAHRKACSSMVPTPAITSRVKLDVLPSICWVMPAQRLLFGCSFCLYSCNIMKLGVCIRFLRNYHGCCRLWLGHVFTRAALCRCPQLQRLWRLKNKERIKEHNFSTAKQ